MSLYFRLFYILFCGSHKESLTPLEESVLCFRVLPTDINLQRHLHEGQYLNIMELGRMDLANHMGLLKLIRRQRWKWHVVAANLHYLRPLRLLQKYELHTRLVCWDNQSLYFEHRFQYKKKTVAIAQIKAVICGRSDTVAPGYILELLSYDSASPTMPITIQHWKRVS